MPTPPTAEAVRAVVQSGESDTPEPAVEAAGETLRTSLSTAELEYLTHLDWRSLSPEAVTFDPVVREAMNALRAQAATYWGATTSMGDTGSSTAGLCATEDTGCMIYLANSQLVLSAIAVLGVGWVCPPCALGGIIIALLAPSESHAASDLPPADAYADPTLFECVSGGTLALDCLSAAEPSPSGDCPSGYMDCGEGFCVNLQSAYRNCGGCDVPICASGLCVDGVCAPSMGGGGRCGNGIVDEFESSDDASRCVCSEGAAEHSESFDGPAECRPFGDCGDGVLNFCERSDDGSDCECESGLGCARAELVGAPLFCANAD